MEIEEMEIVEEMSMLEETEMAIEEMEIKETAGKTGGATRMTGSAGIGTTVLAETETEEAERENETEVDGRAAGRR